MKRICHNCLSYYLINNTVTVFIQNFEELKLETNLETSIYTIGTRKITAYFLFFLFFFSNNSYPYK